MPTPPHPRVRPSLRRTADRRALVAGVLLATVVLPGCSLPSADTVAPATDPSEAPLGTSTPDPSRVALVEEVERLAATVAAARGALARAVGAGTTTEARSAAEAALDLLIAEPGADGADPGDGPRPLFAAETVERDESGDTADQLTATLTRARDVGGALGNTVVDLLREPIAGDLGAWQRDAGGVLASIDETLASASTLEELEVAVGELPGLGTRAVAWARLVAATSDLDAASAFAERGVANLDVIQVTLDRLEPTP
jgi:hypothetical protein